MNRLEKLAADYFGEGLPIQQREPEPIRKSDTLVAYAGAIFLISVATYLPIVALQDRAYLENRRTKVLEQCVLETNRFAWCWTHLTS